jgi:hypothetical protein
MLIVDFYYSYVSVIDEILCVFVPDITVKGTVFMVICVLILVINIRGVHKPSLF